MNPLGPGGLAPRRTWTAAEFQADLAIATEAFRVERIEEPLERYLDAVDRYRAVYEDLLERTLDLTRFDAQALELLSDPEFLEAIRYLPGPPISRDDLKTVAEAVSLSPQRLQRDPDLVRRLVTTIRTGLDRRRFPWVSDGRDADDDEKTAAILSSATLLASQRTAANRRNEGRDDQEQRLKEALAASAFREVRRRPIHMLTDSPGPGEFCGEVQVGGAKADVVVGLWDRRVLALECKVSNSATNSVKRLNREAAAKAAAWRRDFGERQIVPAALLKGVFRLQNLESAQERGLSIFWSHRLTDLTDWIESTRPR